MYILTSTNGKQEGAYAVANKYGESVLFIFQEKEDAERYLEMLTILNYPPLKITEVSEEVATLACDHLGYEYAIITPNDIVVPPDYVKVSKNKI
jgi:hypothetical protein